MIRAEKIEKRAVKNARIGIDAPKHRYTFEDFRQDPVAANRGGAAVSGATGARNLLTFGHNVFEEHIKGAGQTIIVPVLTAEGLDISLDQVSTEGVELTQGILARSEVTFVAGTDGPFSVRAKIKVEDASGANPLLVGFRKAEAYQADEDDYDEMAAIGIVGTSNPNLIKIQTILNAAATVSTDTTQTWADLATKDLKVTVAGNRQVSYQINGLQPTVIPATFTFDSGEVLVPFIYFLHAADLAGEVELIEFECGLDNEA